MAFLRRVESQLNSISIDGGSLPTTSNEEKFGVYPVEEDQEGSDEEMDIPDLGPCTEDQELKHHLLKKYGGCLSSLRQELSKKKKKQGKLPMEARQQLLNWWELHYKWPYPSETQKAVLAAQEGIGGDAVCGDGWGFQAPSAAAASLYMDGPVSPWFLISNHRY
ncbi:hypothetical protein C4D60_Mb08t04580 [Musa balbisiana]|uniref:ELK domain-containing protein n=1 Tax=Musa balbisiana TaxID=52838 RepID=A0A4S8K1A6_MUSBA|nr:hypothetical protein C4D60_Mb08t04580 [Musa balbisiana]